MKNFLRKIFHASSAALIVTVFVSIVSAQNMFRKVNDFDCDGKADFAVTRGDKNNLKQWWIWQTTAGLRVAQFGLGGDFNAAGDYDGDGKTDLAVWRRPAAFEPFSTYYFLESQTNTFAYRSLPNLFLSTYMHQDYDGDGKTDPAVSSAKYGAFNNIHIHYSTTNTRFSTNISTVGIGIRSGDMDGDGNAELSYFEGLGANRVTMINLGTNVSRSVRFGLESDRFQMADFDGDGKGDLTIRRNSDGTWWWIRSTDNVVNVATWGLDGDTPVPADYDGDGKTDLAIWRPGAQSYYWIYGSQSGVNVVAWGISTDSVVSY